MKQKNPSDYKKAIAFDVANRNNSHAIIDGVSADELFIYKTAIPLDEADLENDAKRERKDKQIPLMVCNDGQCWT